MKVGQGAADPLLKVTPQAAQPAKKEAAAKEAVSVSTQGATSAAQGSVSVTVSSSVRALEQLRGTGEAADIDTDKVRAVRDAIANGTYVVNAEAIADKLLSGAEEFLAPRSVH
ncbi:flagellar biosynthesis anti-sigma factor FlgM [Hylemonella gracilis]|uniref:Negative regulator of flagellin synthesis n=1 Tax=Hylemonella gracilis ATCC 19624 TaxID=887062 RepID=F3KXY0_9BURK|nr:flagellar biosynthesis anti-sigma factor FlgM [Hylemonella gracilis]EGI75405.1 putative anti-sigma-28 factor FlgM [Hylemonella gracilis ATCC 19624]